MPNADTPTSPQKGDRVEFLGFGCPDPSDLEPGTLGTVTFVDGAGTIHVRWDDGRQLGLVTRPWPSESRRGFKPDRFRLLPSPELGEAARRAITRFADDLEKLADS